MRFFKGMMTSYIRGKKFTKWDADSENLDMDIPSGAQRPIVAMPDEGCFYGTKGKVMKFLFVAVIFMFGVLIGYAGRKNGPPPLAHPDSLCHALPPDVFLFAQYLHDAINPTNIQQWQQYLNKESDLSKSKKLAIKIEQEWKFYGLPSVMIETFNVLLPQPSQRNEESVHLEVEKNDSKGNLIKLTLSQKSNSLALLPFSPNVSSFQGQLLYADSGSPENMVQALKNLNTSSSKFMFLVKEGGGLSLGQKARLAAEYGASCLLVICQERCEASSTRFESGDPSATFFPSVGDIYQKPMIETNWLPLPVLTINSSATTELLNIVEEKVPCQPSFNQTNCLENENTFPINVQVTFTAAHFETPLYNVIGRIPGDIEPNKYVILGTPHDSSIHSTSVLMELVRGFAVLYQKGWKPSRTLIFASWDATGSGLLGAMKWIKQHQQELHQGAVAYISIDIDEVSGANLSLLKMSGSPLLYQAALDVSSEVLSPLRPGATALDLWQESTSRTSYLKKGVATPRLLQPGSADHLEARLETSTRPPVQPQDVETIEPRLDVPNGWYTDLEAFLLYSGISSLKIHYTSNSQDQADMGGATTAARLMGSLAVKLSSSLELPLLARHYAVALEQGLLEYSFKTSYKTLLEALGPVYMDILKSAVEEFVQACHHFDEKYKLTDQKNLLLKVHEFNQHVLFLERAFVSPLSSHGYFRHLLLGPAPGDLKTGIYFPHIQRALANNLGEVALAQEVSSVILALHSASSLLSDSLAQQP